MKAAFYSTNFDTIDYWKKEFTDDAVLVGSDEELSVFNAEHPSIPVIADYDSVAQSINRMLQEDLVIDSLVVLERKPNLTTGKMLINRGIKAYGNSRMLNLHFRQLLDAVSSENIWMYPELMQAVVQDTNERKKRLPNIELLERLTEKEQEVTLLVLEGLSNSAISRKLGITVRTVKAHISSIFGKLHVNDRIALVILLK